MSASREKKLRQGTEPATTNVDSKQNTKKKTVLYSAIAVVVVVLVAALLIWDSGIIQRNTVAATIGDTSYSPAEVGYYYTSAYQNVYMMAQYGMNDYNPYLTPQEQTTTDADGKEITYHELFIDSALDSLHSVTALYDAAIAAGYKESDVSDTVEATMSETETSVKNSGYSSIKQWLIASVGKSMTLPTFRDIITREALADLYLNDYVESLEYTDAELDAYYKEHINELNTFDFGYLYFSAGAVSSKDENGKDLSDAEIESAQKKALEAAKELADNAAKQLEKAKTVADRSAALDKLIAEANPSFSSAVTSTLGSSISNAVYFEWLSDSSRQSGDVSVIEGSESGYYVVLFMDNYLDETPSAKIRHLMIKATASEGNSTPTANDMALAKEHIELLVEVWRADGATEEGFAELANTNSQDNRDSSGSLNAPGGLYDPVYKGVFVPSLNEWIFDTEAREPGQVGIIENNGDSNYYGYHAVYFGGYNEGDFAWKAAAKNTLSNNAATAHRAELLENYTITEQSGMKHVFS